MRLKLSGWVPLLAAMSTCLAVSPAQADEGYPKLPFVAFPQHAGEAEGFGLAVTLKGESCRVEEPTGNPATDAFACAVGPTNMGKKDGRIYALTFLPPRYEGRYVPASPIPFETQGANRRDEQKRRIVARRRFVERLVIDETGHVVQCVLETPSGNAEFDARICESDKKQRFVPATLDGVAVRELRYEIIEIARAVMMTTTPPWEMKD